MSGRQILRALADGEHNTEKIADFARGQLKKQQPELRRALTGWLTKAQRFVLSESLNRIDELAAAVVRVNEELRKEVSRSTDSLVAEAVKLLETIPGIGQRMAQAIIAEIGVEMSRFGCTSGELGWDVSWQQ